MRVTPCLVAVLCLALSACSGDDDTVTTTAPTTTSLPAPASTTVPTSNVPATSLATTPTSSTPAPSTTMPDTLLSVADERLAFTIALPEEHVLTNSFEWDEGDRCVAPAWDLADGIAIEAWPASCSPVAERRPGNGRYGHYRTLADVPDPVDPVEVDTVLGPATVVGQLYYHCTDECKEWDLDIAIIELSEPVNHEYPTLTVIGTRRTFERADLLDLLEAFGAG